MRIHITEIELCQCQQEIKLKLNIISGWFENNSPMFLRLENGIITWKTAKRTDISA